MTKFLQNQSAVFLCMEEFIRKLVTKKDEKPLCYDSQNIIGAILISEGTEIIINNPDITAKELCLTLEYLFYYLQENDRWQVELISSNNTTLSISGIFKLEIKVCIKTLDFYLFDVYGETTGSREDRLKNYIRSFLRWFPDWLKDHGYEKPKEISAIFSSVLDDFIVQHYFISKAEFEYVLAWLITEFNERKSTFSKQKAGSGISFNLQYNGRNFKLRFPTHYPKIS